MRIVVVAVFLLAWRNRQTRTAQDRMGQPVEVRVLSRALRFSDLAEQNSSRHTNTPRACCPLEPSWSCQSGSDRFLTRFAGGFTEIKKSAEVDEDSTGPE